MIRIPNIGENTTVTVTTIEGKVYSNCDIPERPLGDAQGGIFAFWGDDTNLVILPMSQVFSVIFHNAVDEKDTN